MAHLPISNPETNVNLVERNVAPNGFQLANPKQSGKLNQADLIALATQIQTADQFTRATAGSKLQVIAEQVRFLQQQARNVLEEANLNKDLHHMACNFRKVPGKTYHVYLSSSGAKYLSMISPMEWGMNRPEFVGSYKLENDMTFTPEEKVLKRERNCTLLTISYQQALIN